MKLLAITILCTAVTAWAAQETPVRKYATRPSNPAAPIIDGRDEDPSWKSAEIAAGFVQNEPHNGQAATEPTEFKIVHDQNNLYVFIRAHDSQPDRMISRLVRRDTEDDSEELGICLDSYLDRRTAFVFSVTLAGVKKDQIMSNDGDNEDDSWDPVWEVQVAREDSGWCAEMRIPFSQLRFSPSPEMIWGLEVYRELPRNQELSLWQPIPKDASGIVHLFGELHGLTGLGQPSRIELLPYSVADLTTGRPEAGNPFAAGQAGHYKGGLDGKIGLSSNITMDFTVNPDFGQVEADPSEVNLTAFETFFEEKRPFFVEGKNIFDYKLFMGDGDLALDRLFYSRRIGRAPQYQVEEEEDEYVQAPANTSILGAVKLSGKTSGGLSLGILDAVTQRERAEIRDRSSSRMETTEPLSNYFAGRMQKDYSRGRTSLGLMVTGTHRKIDAPQLNFLNRAAYTGGLDFRHMWQDQNWLLDIRTAVSHIRGHSDALLETQRSSAHYFQRPDDGELQVDSSATSLSGSGGSLSIGKVGGGHWRFASMTLWRSPGLELNDVGYMRQANQTIQIFWGGYRLLKPVWIFRDLGINVNQWNYWTFAGEHIGLGGNINGYCNLNNNWNLNGGINRESEWLGVSALRGGPALLGPAGTSYWSSVNSDSRRRIEYGLMVTHYHTDNRSVWSSNLDLRLQMRLMPNLSLSLNPHWNTTNNDMQYVDTFDLAGGSRYLMARIEQKSLSMVSRIDYSITPSLSIQFYGQPFVASGAYSRFKHITRPRAQRYEERFQLLDAAQLSYVADDKVYRVDEEGDGRVEYDFEEPDFNFRQFRSNLVLRWEYRPGSTLFLVWSQGRTGSVSDGRFAWRHDAGELFRIYPENVLLLKCNYWFSL